MKKVLFFAFVLFVCMTTASGATDWSVVKSGGSFYISSYSNAGLFFYGKAGESYVITNFNDDSIMLACGIYSATYPTSDGAEAYGYDTIAYSATYNDLYFVACIKAAGTSGDTIVGVLDASFFDKREAASRQGEPTDEEKAAIQKIAYEKLGKR